MNPCISKRLNARTHDGEKDGEYDKAHHLDGLATPGVNEKEGYPITWDQTRHGEDKVADTNIVQVLIHVE